MDSEYGVSGDTVVLLLLLLVISLSISSASVLVLLSGLSASSAAFWRLFIATVFLLLSRRGFVRPRNPRALAVSALSGVFLGLHFALWMESLFLVPVFESTLLVDTYPLLLLVMERLALGGQVRAREVVGLLSGAVFLYLFLGGPGLKLSEGDVYAMTSSLFVASYFLLGRVARSRFGLGTVEYVIPTYASASLTALLYSLVKGSFQVIDTPHKILFALLLALVPMIGGHTLMNYLLGFFKSNIVTSIVFTEPIGASILAYLVLGQVLEPYKVLLGLGVIASVVLVWV
ncbi:DMT family transporter [Thermogladius sp.]|uniref:DMT family transporter n=1 Tax=Thermogladius sp. TaxID=2023064 RepID=UPI003D10AA31